MMKRTSNTFLLFAMLIFIPLSYCEKNDDDPGNPDEPLEFTSLVAEHDTIESGQTTTIMATASGYKLRYNWSASAGDILGSGNEVLYAASPCHIGRNKITCTVIDGKDQSSTKNIYIVVQ